MNSNISMSLEEEETPFLQSGDPIVLENIFVKYSFLPIGTILLYLLTIYYLGPWLMRDRQPIKFKKLILFYNLVTVVGNAWCCYKVTDLVRIQGVKVLCMDADNCERHQIIRRDVIHLAMSIYAMKFLEMLDTIFFVMQKKYDHISNLHSFHHSTVPFLVWFSLRTQTRMHLVMYGLVNSGIHVVMYTYYGLSLLGPRFQFIRRFKKYITLIQIVQFFVMVPYFLYIISIGCAKSKPAVVIFTLHTILLIFLFSDYYMKSYGTIPKRRKLGLKKSMNYGPVENSTNVMNKKVN